MAVSLSTSHLAVPLHLRCRAPDLGSLFEAAPSGSNALTSGILPPLGFRLRKRNLALPGILVTSRSRSSGSLQCRSEHVSALQSSAVADAQDALLKQADRSSQEYNDLMKRQMANPYEYHHDLGIYYHRISDHLIVGSQPQSPQDIDRLHRFEDVSAILNLQQDHDIHYWGINLKLIQDRCGEVGIKHYRRPARDFDPHSLRFELPRMVAVIDKYVSQGKTVYVHCTAGLGRAPGAAIAYLFWFHQMDLGTAYHHLTSIRPCGPKKEAIRAATYDLVKNSRWQPPFEHLPDFAFTDVAPWERNLIQQSVRTMY